MRVQVLWGISLQSGRGQLTSIVGANGAAKTTMLRAIAGTIPPWQGHVIFEGEDVTRVPTHIKAAKGLALSGWMQRTSRLLGRRTGSRTSPELNCRDAAKLVLRKSGWSSR